MLHEGMRCDLHVHTVHSGMCTEPVLKRLSRESYNDPEAVYEILKQRGMDLVTVTDHDSIEAAERLHKFHDFFLSEELTCTLPGGTRAHVGVYDIDERDHMQLQHRRNDFPALLAWLRERRLLFSINHAFSALTGRRSSEDFNLFAAVFPAVEILNGTMPQNSNQYAACWAGAMGKAGLAGSDSHTLRGLGKTYTEVRGARNKLEYIGGLSEGRAVVAGESGAWWKLTSDIVAIGAAMFKERPATFALAPLVLGVPLFALADVWWERAFARRCASLVSGGVGAPQLGYLAEL